MHSDYEAMQTAIARDGASYISGKTDDLRATRRCRKRGYTPENLVTVTLEETYRLTDDKALTRIAHMRGWLLDGISDPEMTPVRDSDGTFYRLDRFGHRHIVEVEGAGE